MKVDLVFEGGGVLGISFIGAYKALKENGYDIYRAAGTSAGSIISSLIIAGYTADELIEILNETEFKQFLSKTKWTKVILFGKLLSLIFNNGVYDSSYIEKWIAKLLKKKGIETFKDVMVNGESRLKVIAADITRRKMLILPDDIAYYGIKPEEMSVAKAVQMSSAIPFFFTPIKLEHQHMTYFIVDGGLLSSFPIWIFDYKEKSIRPTIGLKIKDERSNTSLGRHNIFAYTKDIIDAPINKDETYFVRDKDLVRTILIENNGILKGTDFKLNKESIQYLYDCGYHSTNNFFNQWDFIDYLKKYLI